MASAKGQFNGSLVGAALSYRRSPKVLLAPSNFVCIANFSLSVFHRLQGEKKCCSGSKIR